MSLKQLSQYFECEKKNLTLHSREYCSFKRFWNLSIQKRPVKSNIFVPYLCSHSVHNVSTDIENICPYSSIRRLTLSVLILYPTIFFLTEGLYSNIRLDTIWTFDAIQRNGLTHHRRILIYVFMIYKMFNTQYRCNCVRKDTLVYILIKLFFLPEKKIFS
jgi:hypothetical protein